MVLGCKVINRQYFTGFCLRFFLAGLLFVTCQHCLGRPLPEGWNPYEKYIPTGDGFPGTVDVTEERLTETHTFHLHPRNFSSLRLRFPPRNQQSTGLYRVPGEPVTVTVEPAPTNQSDVRPHLRIGAHFLDLSDMKLKISDRVARPYDVIRLQGAVTTDSDKASGLIYLESDVTGTDSYSITIQGAVKAPWFKVGRDTLEQWRETIRHYPAPWAELEGEYAILALPSAMIREVDDPSRVIAFYDNAVKTMNALAGLSDTADAECNKSPDLPFRFVIDVNLKKWGGIGRRGGITLSGSPFGSPTYWLRPRVHREYAILIHELGHFYETVNKFMGLPGSEDAFSQLFVYGDQSIRGDWFIGERDNVFNGVFPSDDFLYLHAPHLYWPLSRVSDLLFSDYGYRYDSRIWSEKSYTMLYWKYAFMLGLVERLSHEFMPKLYREFRATAWEQLPGKKNQQQKTDFFFESLCKVTGQDLTLYFKHWYVPVSEEAYQRVAEMGYRHPRWLYHDGL